MNIDRVPIDKDEVMFPSPEDMEFERWRDSIGEEMRNAIDEGDITEKEADQMSLMEQEDWLNERKLLQVKNMWRKPKRVTIDQAEKELFKKKGGVRK